MAVAAASSTSRRISGINVTPLVDITLVLLVVLMVTAKIVVQPSLPLDLPAASQASGTQMIFAVLVTPDGKLWVDGEALSGMQDLQTRAQEARAAHQGLRAIISADGSVPHRRVMAVLDTLSAAGIAKIAFGARDQAGGAP